MMASNESICPCVFLVQPESELCSLRTKHSVTWPDYSVLFCWVMFKLMIWKIVLVSHCTGPFTSFGDDFGE